MSAIKVVFLDRGTLDRDLILPRFSFVHHWTEYEHTTELQREERLQGAVIALTNKVRIDEPLLDACPDLAYIGVTATGTNVVDLVACRERGIVVTNVSGYSTNAVAEHVFMFILALRKRLKAYQQSIAEGHWQIAKQFIYYHDTILSLKGTTLGLVGTGTIAQACAQLAQAFGMKVLFHSPTGRVSVTVDEEEIPCVGLEQLLRDADVVSIHTPLSDRTEKLIAADQLALMRRDALLINTARGPIVDSAALAEALLAERIAGAGIDVLPVEPPTDREPLLALVNSPNLLMTPHTAWAALDAQQRLIEGIWSQIEDYVHGAPVHNLCDFV